MMLSSSTPLLTRRHLLTASAINGGGFLMASLATVFWYFLIVRLYPSSESGLLLLAMSVAGLINLLDLGASMGLTSILSTTENEADRSRANASFRSALVIGLGTQFMAGSVAVAVWRALAHPDLSVWACLSVVVFAVSTEAVLLCSSALKGLCNFKAANLVSTGSALSVYGLAAGLAAFKLNVWVLLGAMSCAQLAMGAYAIKMAVSRLHQRRPVPDDAVSHLTTYLNLLRISLPFFPQMVAGIFFMHAQRFIIARYAGLDAVALTSFAYSLATRIHSLVNAFLEIIFPMARRLQAQGITAGTLSLRAGAASAAAYLAVAALGALIVHIVIPEIIPTFLVFAVGVTFAIAAAPAFHVLNGSGASAQVSGCSLVSPFLFIALAEGLYAWLKLDVALLLPLAYAATMAVMLIQVAALVCRHSLNQAPR
jgi:O-antigen/teichoic acid export membrane protein